MTIVTISNNNIEYAPRRDSKTHLLPDKVKRPPRSYKSACVSSRFKLACLAHLACVVLYLNRVNINVAIVSMTSADQVSSNNMSNVNDSRCPSSDLYDSGRSNVSDDTANTSTTKAEFEWSQTTQGIILGSFYWGYICFQTVGSRMAELFGAKWICGLGILFSGLINLATPMIVRLNFYLFIASRVVLGLTQSAVFPSFYAMFVKWFPENERPRYLPWLDAGTGVGTIIIMAASGMLIKSGILGGWPSVFYLPGITSNITLDNLSGFCTILWFIPWAIFVQSDPRNSKSISEDELNYIINSNEEPIVTSQPVPWITILTSKEFLAVFMAKFLLGFTYGMLLTKLPSYLENVINISIEKNGFINSFINIGNLFTLLSGGWLSSIVIQKTNLSKTTVRKIFEAITGFVPAICMALIPLVGCDQLLIIILLVLVVTLVGLASGGDIPIVTEMTSEYPATVFSIMNMFASFTGFLSPYIVGVIINSDPYSMHLWSLVYYLAAILSALGTTIFILFASAESQNWGKIN